MDIRQKAREAANQRLRESSITVEEVSLYNADIIADAVAVAVLMEVEADTRRLTPPLNAGQPIDGLILVGGVLRDLLASLTPEPPTPLEAPTCATCHDLRRELAVTDELLTERQRVLDAIPPCPAHGSCVPHALAWIAAQQTVKTCATCQHYSGDGCADTRTHPMQHRKCEPTWGCPSWEGK